MNDESASRPGRRRRVAVERAEERHREGLLSFFQREWGGDSGDAAEWDPRVPQWVCLRDDEIIGYLGSIPTQMSIRGRVVDAHWLKGFWVTERFRAGPVGPLLLEGATRDLDLVASQVVAPPAIRVMEAGGFTQRCTLFNRVLILRGWSTLSRVDVSALGLVANSPARSAAFRAVKRVGLLGLGGALLAGASRAARSLARLREGAPHIRFGWDVPDRELDEVWKEARGRIHTIPARGATNLRSRYESAGVYELATVWTDGRLRSWAVLRQPSPSSDARLPGVKVASLSDVLYPLDHPRFGAAAVRAAEQLAIEYDSDAVLCSGSHPALDRMLGRRGYLRYPSSVQILARDGMRDAFATTERDMWVTRGDARSDEAF